MLYNCGAVFGQAPQQCISYYLKRLVDVLGDLSAMQYDELSIEKSLQNVSMRYKHFALV